MTYRGYHIVQFTDYFVVIAENDCEYQQEPFWSVDEAKAKIDRHLDLGEPFRLGEESLPAFHSRLEKFYKEKE